MTPGRTLLLASFATCGLLAACGGDDSASETSARATSAVTGPAGTDAATTPTAGGGTAATASSATAGTTGGTWSEDDAAFCEPMQKLSQVNSNTPPPDLTAGVDEIKASITDAYDSVIPLYDETIANAPDDVAAALTALRDATAGFVDDVEAASSEEEIGAAVSALQTDELLGAVTTIEDYTNDTCGFSLSGS